MVHMVSHRVISRLGLGLPRLQNYVNISVPWVGLECVIMELSYSLFGQKKQFSLENLTIFIMLNHLHFLKTLCVWEMYLVDEYDGTDISDFFINWAY